MSATTDSSTCADSGTLLPGNPFEALHVHFGMLLGVPDFETEQAYHRGKMRLHNAWAHRAGVLWGLAVSTDTARGEVRVAAGLALDGAGQELHLDADACVNLPAWLAALSDEDRTALAGADGSSAFDAHVLVRHHACLARQVPALMEPCDGAGRDTAYSRVIETVELLLRPGLAPPPAAPPYHRLRLLFALEGPALDAGGNPLAEDQALLAERATLLGLAQADRVPAALALLRRCANLDAALLLPARADDGEAWLLTPAAPDAGLVLADLRGLRLASGSAGLQLVAGDVDITPRQSLVATQTVQELLAGAFFCCAAAAPAPPAPGPAPGPAPSPGPAPEPEPAPAPEPAPEPAPAPAPPPEDATNRALALAPPSADGLRFDPASVQVGPRGIKLAASAALAPESVSADAFSVAVFVPGEGWKPARITEVEVSGAGVHLRLSATLRRPAGSVLRLVARSGGPTPPLGADLQPLAGGDFVHMVLGS